MRAVVQRVTRASVAVGDEVVGSIGPGVCVLVGVTHDDDVGAAAKLAHKLWHLRILDDADGVMNLSAADAGAPLLIVSQFTLRSEEHTSELQSLMRISYAVFCLKKKKNKPTNHTYHTSHEAKNHSEH